jgi:outer membrane lipoprotein-sorting protein
MNHKRTVIFLLPLLLLFFIPSLIVAQQQDAKAEQIVKDALEAMGGQSYLGVRSVIGKGQYTQYQDGSSGDPSSFIDYIIYPDKERTEFKSARSRAIQANDGDKGWLFDATNKTLKDLTPKQVEEFKFSLRTSLENLLRGGWRTQGAKLSYVGRREAGLAKRNEVVRLTYTDGFSVEFEFGARDHLPSKILYSHKKEDESESAEEDRFAQLTLVSGVMTPFIIDRYENGKQVSRINYQSIEFNAAISQSLFEKPATIKGIK